MEDQVTDKGIFINGKKQIIEMLRFMDEDDRKKLLKNISIRNSAMARELTEKSYTIKDIMRLENSQLSTLLNNINPTIIGLALNLLNTQFQRKALGLMDRNSAEHAYSVMTQNLSSKKVECERALQKIVDTAIELSKRKILNIS